MVKSEKSASRVEEIIDYFAKEKQKKDPTLSVEQARAQVWLERPRLVAAWRLANGK